MDKTLDKFKNYLISEGIQPIGISRLNLVIFISQYNSIVPDDFKKLYKAINGMEGEADKNGFSIWPISDLRKSKETSTGKDLYIFADYLSASWWYGYQLTDNKNYSIGIVPAEGIFIPITNTLETFLEWVMNDDSNLYQIEQI